MPETMPPSRAFYLHTTFDVGNRPRRDSIGKASQSSLTLRGDGAVTPSPEA